MNISLEEAGKLLNKGNSFIITAHVNPDGDNFGSCLSLYIMLSNMGKSVRYVLDDKIDDKYKFLPGFENVERLTDDMQLAADYLVVLDASPKNRCGKVVERCQGMPIINIDHHVSNEGLADYLYLDAKAAACAEIMYRLYREMGAEITTDIATCLYTGIATDCGFFRYSNTSSNTMRYAADLLDMGVKPNRISEALDARSYDHIKAMAEAMQTVEISEGGRVAGLFMTYDMVKDLESTEDFIDQVRVIDGVDVAVFLKEKEPGLCRGSMRSKYSDVCKIAQRIGGGGHIRAAGCTLKMDFATAKETLMKAIHEGLA